MDELKFCVPELIKEIDVLPNSKITLTIEVSKVGRLQVLFSECRLSEESIKVSI